ncbi:hypothetical protein ACHAXS_008530 [Conticribra weissflogii]
MKTNKMKANKNATLSKPKRPISAYNFFFRDERNNILAEAQHDQSPKTFEEIGRIIGKRWREINDEKLETYKEMAAEDTVRYQEEMKSYYHDKLKLMCLGHHTSNDEFPTHVDQTDGSPWKNGEIQGTNLRRVRTEGSACSGSDATKEKSSSYLLRLEHDKQQPAVASSLEDIFGTSTPSQASSKKLYANHGASDSSQEIDLNQATLKSATLPVGSNNQSLLNDIANPQIFQLGVMQNLHAQNSFLLKQIVAQKDLIERQQKEIEHLKKVSGMKDALLQRAIAMRDLKSVENNKPAVTALGPMTTAALRVNERDSPNTAAPGLSFGATAQTPSASAAATSTPKLSPADILSLMMLMGKGRCSRGS